VNPLFLDTSFLLALVLSDDQHHQRALAWQRRVRQPLLTTEYVILELADALAGTELLRRVAVRTIEIIRTDATVRVAPASTSLLNEGLHFFSTRPDKRWSLTDCISFVVMQNENAREALSSDHHFEQAGFTALLRRDPT
jgi:predicted nucleic acid-binding protein